MTEPTIIVALLAGLASFIAPCILPMIPAFLAYISGTTLYEIKNPHKSNVQINKINIVINTIFFVLGFSIVFSTLGVLINSALLENVNQFTESLNIIAGIIIIAGTYGDLIESLFKRSIEIKDSGSILPGHGGFMDRFDGLLLSAPFITAFLKIW